MTSTPVTIRAKKTVLYSLLQVIAIPALVIATNAYQAGNTELAIGGFVVGLVAIIGFVLSIQFDFAWEDDVQDVLESVEEWQVEALAQAIGDAVEDVIENMDNEDGGGGQ